MRQYNWYNKITFFLLNKIYISLELIYKLFHIKTVLFPTHPPNPLIKIAKYHRLSYVQNKHFRLPFRLSSEKKKNILFLMYCIMKNNIIYNSSYINIVTYIVLFTISKFTYTKLYTFSKDFTKRSQFWLAPTPKSSFCTYAPASNLLFGCQNDVVIIEKIRSIYHITEVNQLLQPHTMQLAMVPQKFISRLPFLHFCIVRRN